MSKVKEISLENLCCASCASKIEARVKALDGILDATLNFVLKKLRIEVENPQDFDLILDKIKGIVLEIEPDVKVILIDDKKNKDVEEFNYREKMIKLSLACVFFIIPMVFDLPKQIGFTLYLISYIISGGHVVKLSFKNILKGDVFDENFLMTIATFGAFGIGEYPEAAAVMLFYNIGEFFEGVAVNRSRKSISALIDIKPEYANLIVGSNIMKVDPNEVRVGDTILVKLGEKVPLDGIIVEGETLFDTSIITGESIPKQLTTGDEVLSGFINSRNPIKVIITNEFENSTLSKILELVQGATSKKAKAENFISKFAKVYTPIVVVLALLLAFVPPFFDSMNFAPWIYRALIFLVISCPCALVISIPLTFFAGIGAASKKGILIKGSNFLETLNEVKTAVFDKTGTLTKGSFKVVKINSTHMAEEKLLEYAAYSEVYSNHPIAYSIKDEYGKEIDKNLVESYTEVPGLGIKAKINGHDVCVGNTKLMDGIGVKFDDVHEIGTLVHVSVNGVYQGYILIADEIKKDSKEAIKNLKSLGIKRTIMLTGDNSKSAEMVSKEIGIDEYYSDLLPQDKVAILEDLKKRVKGKILFVGDGVNDSPVLALSDVGISMGNFGSDAAIQASDIVIMTDEPSKIAKGIEIAKKTRSIVIQNIILALSIKIVVLVLGTLGLATMWEAVFADVGATVLTVLNSIRGIK